MTVLHTPELSSTHTHTCIHNSMLLCIMVSNKCRFSFYSVCDFAFFHFVSIRSCFCFFLLTHTAGVSPRELKMSPAPATSLFCPYAPSVPFVHIWFPKVCEHNRCLLRVFSLIVWTYAECRREHGGTMRELSPAACNQTPIEEEREMHR